eukprot:CAMPEP_0184975452 /NCGR_PEP_ID=MMETSP1098-20130426/6705_1 /TAXON_ID=89044 /ORGANISM="Spumella elongata, Strain CCAP 955/1" /LENGTH=481 /DNA_ID=CAMNT_0027498199 /DNA_START=18 /DNA_END=1463 /DNA_ORIENTATION=-
MISYRTTVASLLTKSTRKAHIATGAVVKPKVVVIGCGWAGYRFAQDIDKSKYHVSLVSPRNHFLFTPLLPSTAVGTLEFRCIQEPVRTIPGLHYAQASCDDIDYIHKKIHCTEVYKMSKFSMEYDYLVLAPGSETNTFNVPGVDGNPRIFFLKQLHEARSIRNKLIESFERASLPSITPQERSRLLTFVVVGGGPTNVEFASELYDFLMKDVARNYADLLPFVSVHVVEASGHILGSFKSSLVDYVEKLFESRSIKVRLNTTVKAIKDGSVAVLGDGTELPFGLMVWSTGVKQVSLIRALDAEFSKGRGGRLLMDDKLRLLAGPDAQGGKPGEPLGEGTVYAMGDCACDSVKPLPALAQVAAQQAIYLAKTMNQNSDLFAEAALSTRNGEEPQSVVHKGLAQVKPFQYAHLGSMASVGDWKGVVDTSNISQSMDGPPVKGFLAFLLWRAAYWTKQVSIVNKIMIPMYWFKSTVFGRDISRF